MKETPFTTFSVSVACKSKEDAYLKLSTNSLSSIVWRFHEKKKIY